MVTAYHSYYIDYFECHDFLQNEVRCIWCETGRNCYGEKREGQSAKDYLLILILIFSN